MPSSLPRPPQGRNIYSTAPRLPRRIFAWYLLARISRSYLISCPRYQATGTHYASHHSPVKLLPIRENGRKSSSGGINPSISGQKTSKPRFVSNHAHHPALQYAHLKCLPDQNDRRMSILGSIRDQPGILIIERAAFIVDLESVSAFTASLTNINNLSANDIYHWYLASSGQNQDGATPADLKLSLIWPCTDQHISKYSAQNVRMVTETPEIYQDYVRPYMRGKRENGRLNWVYNIIEGRKEQEDVILRVSDPEEGFLLLPDLNWDRKTIGTLRLLALVERRDIWSLRDLKKRHVVWLRHMRSKILDGVVKVYPQLDHDQLKLYVHCKFYRCFGLTSTRYQNC